MRAAISRHLAANSRYSATVFMELPQWEYRYRRRNFPSTLFDNDALRLVTASVAQWPVLTGTNPHRRRFTPRPIVPGDRGMSSTDSAELYRTHAAQCIEIALRAPVETRLELLNIAQAWLALAEHAEKNVQAPHGGL